MKDKRVLWNLILMIVLGVAVAACSLVYVYQKDYQNTFLPGTTVNGVNVAGMNVAEAEKTVEKEYTLKVIFREKKKETLKGADIGYELEGSDASIEKAAKNQTFPTFLSSIYLGKEKAYTLTGTCDTGKLKKATGKWKEMQKKHMRKPKAAHVAYEDGKFRVAAAEKGTVVKQKKARKTMAAAVAEGATALNLTKVKGIYTDHTGKVSEKQLEKDCKTLSKMKWATVTYKLPDGSKKTLDANTMVEWLVRDESGNLIKDEYTWNQHIITYVANLADKVDTVYKSHKFKNHNGKVIHLKGRGYYGWCINQSGEVDKLTQDLNKGKSVKRKPVYSQTEVTDYDDNYGFGDTYVEINLSAQHLWFYKDGEVAFETDVVSGTRGSHETPDGAFFLLAKSRDVTLRGPEKTTKDKDGNKKTTYEWESPVSYWMPINYEGIGMHDANWRGSFGGDIWTYNGSHGCINLPPSKTGTFYNMIEVGTPVAVYY